MESGIIIVDGGVRYDDGSEHVCKGMKGGIVKIKGDVQTGVGEGMQGGIIIIDGECERLPQTINGGKIFYRGKLIFNK
jgi:glutamate synthase domain-containing protein 3